MWLGMNHAAIAEKAYRQTGPTLPLEPLLAGDGGVTPESLGLYRDLQPFWPRISGQAVFDEAVAHVDRLWQAGIVTGWADAATVVEAHEAHPGILEGLEGAEWEVEEPLDAGVAAAADGAVVAEGIGAAPEAVDSEAEGMVDADDAGSAALLSA